ncbi:15605_t:CDS:2 [Funneliformis geosporum]|uniref:15605_t:CDS:1 n=1 Tax=Funneliformis geosporum TaxID=1117311 RepID=A0A9W4SSQ0_9GLOM|nr:15605_t:CDS:2 [Funneliformis geosporum]
MSAPFVCKWSDAHLKQQRFNTRKELELHIDNDHDDLSNLGAFLRGHPIYICPWEGCKNSQRDIIKLKGANDMTNITNCDDDTLYDENVKQAKEQIDTREKLVNEPTYISPNISYAQKAKASTALDEIDFANENEEICALKYMEKEVVNFDDYDPENYDDLPDAPKEREYLTDYEKDGSMWEAYCESHKGSKFVEMINKALEDFNKPEFDD